MRLERQCATAFGLQFFDKNRYLDESPQPGANVGFCFAHTEQLQSSMAAFHRISGLGGLETTTPGTGAHAAMLQ